MEDFKRSIRIIARIKEQYKDSIGKHIIVKGDKPFSDKNQYHKSIKYMGTIEACYPEFFIVRRESGTKTTYQYKDVYMSIKNKSIGFKIL